MELIGGMVMRRSCTSVISKMTVLTQTGWRPRAKRRVKLVDEVEECSTHVPAVLWWIPNQEVLKPACC